MCAQPCKLDEVLISRVRPRNSSFSNPNDPARPQACPHVSGVVARCYAAGECGSETDTEAERIAGLARERLEANPGYGFAGDAVASPSASQYYGYPVWAARW
jgi:hypothetical protein